MCKEDGCENNVRARGWCPKHYQCWRKYGDPLFTKHHGYSGDPLYRVWKHMKGRCYNKNDVRYKNYGGRGIEVCNEWMNLESFIEWASPLWRKGLQIDRCDNDGDYCPENCRFVTPKENMHNQRLLRSTNTSGYRGVSYFKRDKKWKAQITIDNKEKHIGYFNTPEEAAIAYDAAVPDNRPKNLL